MRTLENRTDFMEYCLRRLGKGVIEINVSKEQIEDRMDDAILVYMLRHFDATEERVLVKQITYQDVRNGYIELPKEVISVVEVLKTPSNSTGTSSSYLFDFDYQINLNDYLQNNGMYSYSGQFSQIYMLKSNVSLMKWVTEKEQRYEYNHKTSRLFLYDDLESLADSDSYVAMITHIFVGEIAALWNDEWLRDYTTQLIKRQWADNLRKYGSVTLPSGVTLNGDTMFTEAITEIQRLEDQLKTDYELPFDFYIG